MRNPYGWHYPAGAEKDPNAPWNQIDNGEEDEHEAMLNCKCPESDRLLAWCVKCGKTTLPDPSWFVVAAGFALLGLNVWSWWAL